MEKVRLICGQLRKHSGAPHHSAPYLCPFAGASRDQAAYECGDWCPHFHVAKNVTLRTWNDIHGLRDEYETGSFVRLTCGGQPCTYKIEEDTEQ